MITAHKLLTTAVS